MTGDALYDLLGRKWTTRLLLALRAEPRGFSELERTLGVTSKYRLTDGGRGVADRLAALAEQVGVTDCPAEETDRCVVTTATEHADPTVGQESVACCPGC